MSKKLEYKGKRAIVLNRDTRELRDVSVIEVKNGCVETIDGIYPEKDGMLCFDTGNQEIVYVFGVDEECKVEAEKLKELRRNVVMSKLFDYKMDKPFDVFALFPWIIIVLLIFFK